MPRRANRTLLASAVVVSELTVTPMLVAASAPLGPQRVAAALVPSSAGGCALLALVVAALAIAGAVIFRRGSARGLGREGV